MMAIDAKSIRQERTRTNFAITVLPYPRAQRANTITPPRQGNRKGRFLVSKARSWDLGFHRVLPLLAKPWIFAPNSIVSMPLARNGFLIVGLGTPRLGFLSMSLLQ